MSSAALVDHRVERAGIGGVRSGRIPDDDEHGDGRNDEGEPRTRRPAEADGSRTSGGRRSRQAGRGSRATERLADVGLHLLGRRAARGKERQRLVRARRPASRRAPVWKELPGSSRPSRRWNDVRTATARRVAPGLTGSPRSASFPPRRRRGETLPPPPDVGSSAVRETSTAWIPARSETEPEAVERPLRTSVSAERPADRERFDAGKQAWRTATDCGRPDETGVAEVAARASRIRLLGGARRQQGRAPRPPRRRTAPEPEPDPEPEPEQGRGVGVSCVTPFRLLEPRAHDDEAA
jgi:hypothetical protein